MSGFNFLLHTWSLGVEVQFYIIAPWILKFISSNPNQQILRTIFLMVLSLLGFIVLPSKADFVLFRLWQFLVGADVYYLSKYHEKIENRDPESDCLLEASEKVAKVADSKSIFNTCIFVFYYRPLLVFDPSSFWITGRKSQCILIGDRAKDTTQIWKNRVGVTMFRRLTIARVPKMAKPIRK